MLLNPKDRHNELNKQVHSNYLPANNFAFLWSPSSITRTFSCKATNAAAQRMPTCLIPPPKVFLSLRAYRAGKERKLSLTGKKI